jgi:hypothetical protein
LGGDGLLLFVGGGAAVGGGGLEEGGAKHKIADATSRSAARDQRGLASPWV